MTTSTHVDVPLKFDDYTLVDGAAWFSVGGFSIKIHADNERVAVDIYQNGMEMDPAFDSAYAYFSELRSGDDK